MVEHLEKEKFRYVIATFDNPTNYLVANGNCTYSFIDNIERATKFIQKQDAECVYSSCITKVPFDLVVIPIKIKYILLEEEE